MTAQVIAWFAAYRVLMVWACESTESVLLAMLMHASLTASQVMFASLATAVPLFTYTLVFGAVVWLVIGVVALAQGGHLTRQPLLRRRVT